jgi:hypothetical protein
MKSEMTYGPAGPGFSPWRVIFAEDVGKSDPGILEQSEESQLCFGSKFWENCVCYGNAEDGEPTLGLTKRWSYHRRF